MKRALLFAVLGLAGLTGCSSFDRVEFDPETTPPAAAEVTYERITIPKGIAVAEKATPMSGNDELDDVLELRSRDASILGVSPGIDEKTFVFYGVSAGKTSVGVYVDGDLEGEIPAEVPLQDAEP